MNRWHLLAGRTLVASASFLCVLTLRAQTPPRELNVPDGTALNGLSSSGLAYSAQTLWYLQPSAPAQVVWSVPLGVSITDAASDGQASGDRYILQSDGSFFSFFVYAGGFSTPTQRSTITPLTPGFETFKKVLGNPLIVLTNRRLYVSQDAGVTWTPDTAGFGNSLNNDVALSPGGGLLTVTSGGLYRRGLSETLWHRDTSIRVTNMSTIFVDRRGRIFIGVSSGANALGVYGSTDGGVTWTRDTTGMGGRSITRVNDDAFGNVYAVTDQGQRVYQSPDGGQSWTRIDGQIIPTVVDPVPAVTFYNFGGDSTVYGASVFGLFVSRDRGASWSEHNEGMPAENVGTIEHLSGGRVLVATDLGVFKRDAGDASWTRTYPTSGYIRITGMYHDGSGALYIPGPHAGAANTSMRAIFKSADRGMTWVADSAGVSTVRRTGTYFVDERGTQHLAVGATSASALAILYSKPSGGSWTADTAGFVSTGTTDAPAAMVSNGAGQIFLSGLFSGGNLWTRPVAGGSWTLDTAGADTARILSMRRDHDGNIVAAARNGRFLKRTGGRWTRIAAPAGRDSADAYFVSVDSTGAIAAAYRTTTGFLTTPVGAYITANNGALWHFAGLAQYTITNMVSYGDTTYAMIAGRGAFRLSSTFLPALHLAATDISFGTVNIGESADRALVITNSGTDTLRVTSITADHPEYTLQSSAFTLAPGATMRDTVHFMPTAAVVVSGSVTIVSNAATSPDHATLTGVGRSSTLQLSTRLVDFGSVRVSRTASKAITITNHGADTLHLTSIVATSPKFIVRPFPSFVLPGASIVDTLQFAPLAAGLANGLVIVTSSSPSSPDTVQVTGAGTAPVLQVTRLFPCGTTKVGKPISAVYTVRNSGTDTLTIGSATTTNPVFQFRSVRTVLAPGATVADTIVFTPTALDTTRGQLIIVSDALSSPDTITIYGIGTSASAVQELAPRSAELGGVFPNPMSTFGTVPLMLAQGGRVTMTIVDALGRTVATVVDRDLSAGPHDVRVDVASLTIPNGVYFLTCRAPQFSAMRRVTVAR